MTFNRFFINCFLLGIIPFYSIHGNYFQNQTCDWNRGIGQQLENDSFCEDSNFDFLSDCCADEAWDLWAFPNYFTLGYTGGRGLSYHHGYTEAGIFLSPSVLKFNRFVSFVDGKGYVFNNGKGAANVGVGIRTPFSDWDLVAGLNVYYDYRKFRRENLNQIGIGFELFSKWADLRINGYLPVGKQNHRKGTLFAFGDDFYSVTFDWTQVYRGIDAEVGTWILKKRPCNFVGLYFAIGPYFYHREHKKNTVHDTHRVIRGGKARLVAKIHDYVDLTISGTYDNFFHGTVQGQITLNIPFTICDKFSSGLCDREFLPCIIDQILCTCEPLPCTLDQMLIQPVERNGIIVADSDCTMLWNWSGACPCSCEESCSCSSSSGCSGLPCSRSWHSSRFCSDFFPYPYYCSECHSRSRSCK